MIVGCQIKAFVTELLRHPCCYLLGWAAPRPTFRLRLSLVHCCRPCQTCLRHSRGVACRTLLPCCAYSTAQMRRTAAAMLCWRLAIVCTMLHGWRTSWILALCCAPLSAIWRVSAQGAWPVLACLVTSEQACSKFDHSSTLVT